MSRSTEAPRANFSVAGEADDPRAVIADELRDITARRRAHPEASVANDAADAAAKTVAPALSARAKALKRKSSIGWPSAIGILLGIASAVSFFYVPMFLELAAVVAGAFGIPILVATILAALAYVAAVVAIVIRTRAGHDDWPGILFWLVYAAPAMILVANAIGQTFHVSTIIALVLLPVALGATLSLVLGLAKLRILFSSWWTQQVTGGLTGAGRIATAAAAISLIPPRGAGLQSSLRSFV